jgi:HK97 family phage prohead protease
MFDHSEAPKEYAVTREQKIGAELRTVVRPDEVRAMVPRLYAWRSAAESCKVCLAASAVRIRSGQPICQRCLEIRTAQHADIAAIRAQLPKTHTERSAFERGVSGYAIVFNSRSVDLGGFREIILPDAVTRSISGGDDLSGLWNHDSSNPLGRIGAGTLRVHVDRTGLWADYDMPPSAVSQMDAARRRDVRGQSFAFRAFEDDWMMDGDMPIRYVIDMKISEVSIVTFPAYSSTTIGVGQNPQRSIEWYQRMLKQASA